MTTTRSDARVFFDELSALLRGTGVMREVEQVGDVLVCHAAGTVEAAQFRVSPEGGRVWVSLVTKDRWLSGSVEADLMNSGDKLEELIEDELADLDEVGLDDSVGPVSGGPISFEHFRSEDLYFTFRSPIEVPEGGLSEVVERVGALLLAYVACFAQLGDMSEAGDDD